MDKVISVVPERGKSVHCFFRLTIRTDIKRNIQGKTYKKNVSLMATTLQKLLSL